jgi:hypothetical protein
MQTRPLTPTISALVLADALGWTNTTGVLSVMAMFQHLIFSLTRLYLERYVR